MNAREKLFKYLQNQEPEKFINTYYYCENVYKDDNNELLNELLILATAYNNTKILSFLLSKDVDKNIKNASGCTPIMNMAKLGNIDVFKKLFFDSSVCLTNISNTGENLLICASQCMHHNLEILKLIISKNLFNIYDTDNNGRNILIHSLNNLDRLTYLITDLDYVLDDKTIKELQKNTKNPFSNSSIALDIYNKKQLSEQLNISLNKKERKNYFKV